MKNKYWSIALAYTGIIVGAGLSSGQDLLQYFLCFGTPGLIGVAVLGLLNIIFGKIILTLGCYYHSASHQEVLQHLTAPLMTKIVDWTLIIASYVMGFVMIAGAGANLEQQFQIPSWIGAAVCTILIIAVSYLDIDKITGVLGMFTPIIILMILAVAIYTWAGKSYDFAALSAVAQTIQPAIPSLWLSVLNYFALCLMTGVTMAFVLGGSVIRISEAQKGGSLGGTMIALIIIAASFTLFANISTARQAEIPMLAIISQISPIFSLIYSIVIFCLIFNTAFSLLYGCAQRLSVHHPQKKNRILILLSATGFLFSFGGFQSLISWMYPVLGYMGIFLIVILAWGWIREKENIAREKKVRRQMIGLQIHRFDQNRDFTSKEKKALFRLGRASKVDTRTIMQETESLARTIVEQQGDVTVYEEALQEPVI